MSDPVHVPDPVVMLARASAIVRNELVESIRPAILVADTSVAARRDAAIAAVFRVLAMPGPMAHAVGYVAGVRLDDELKRSLMSGVVPLPPRCQVDALASGPSMAIEEMLHGTFEAIVGTCNVDDEDAEQVTASHLADEAMRVIQSQRGRANVAYLCGLQAMAVMAESIGGAA